MDNFSFYTTLRFALLMNNCYARNKLKFQLQMKAMHSQIVFRLLSVFDNGYSVFSCHWLLNSVDVQY